MPIASSPPSLLQKSEIIERVQGSRIGTTCGDFPVVVQLVLAYIGL